MYLKAAQTAGKAKPIDPKKVIAAVMHVYEIATNSDLKMVLRMTGGEIRVLDFRKIIPANKVFEVLKDPRIFQTAEAFGSGVRWESVDIDIEVADLYEDSEPVDLQKIIEHVA